MKTPKVTWTGDEEDYDEWFWPVVFASATDCVSLLDKPSYKWRTAIKDTSALWNEKNKVKMKSVSPEPVSGGEMWTFSNGMKVIYKKMPTSGRFSYSFMIKGGFSTVRDLRRGEGAFFSDMFGLCNIAGMSRKRFRQAPQSQRSGDELRCLDIRHDSTGRRNPTDLSDSQGFALCRQSEETFGAGLRFVA